MKKSILKKILLVNIFAEEATKISIKNDGFIRKNVCRWSAYIDHKYLGIYTYYLNTDKFVCNFQAISDVKYASGK